MLRAEVLFKDEPAGILEQTVSGASRFTYAPDWTHDIACCFPVTQREHEWAGGLHPFFQHLGPEGWLREQQARGGHIETEDDFRLLLRYGADCIGAVGIRPLGDVPGLPAIAEGTPTPGRTISGIQKKLLVVKNGASFAPAGPYGPASYIAKFNSNAIDTLVRNELRTLQWSAAILGSKEVTEFALGQVQGEIALVVTRFDRTPKGEKLRLEDFAQILQKPRGADYGGKYNSSYEEVAAVIKEHSSRTVIDLARFYRRLIVFALVANCDAHLKNFSLLETQQGLRLSPVYDVLNTALYDNYDRNFGLAFLGEYRHIETLTGTLFREFGRVIGLPGTAIDQIFNDLKKQVDKNPINPPPAEGPDGFVTRFAEIVRNQCLRIFEE